MELWKRIFINGSKTKYEVSSLGRVRNRKTGKIVKGCVGIRGYVQLNIFHGNKRYTRTVHQLVANAFIPNPNNLPQVNHKNGIKTDNSVDNLEWVTSSENIKHAFATGLKTQYGESNPANKYPKNKIIEVCELLQSGKYTCKEIASITGVHPEIIGHISRKERWQKISENYDFSKVKRAYDNHSRYTISVDRAIKFGRTRKEILTALESYGLTKTKATNLYKRRKESVITGKSLVNCDAYIDEGIEIFEGSTTIETELEMVLK